MNDVIRADRLEDDTDCNDRKPAFQNGCPRHPEQITASPQNSFRALLGVRIAADRLIPPPSDLPSQSQAVQM